MKRLKSRISVIGSDADILHDSLKELKSKLEEQRATLHQIEPDMEFLQVNIYVYEEFVLFR